MESQFEHFKQKHPNEKMWLCLDHVVWSKLSTNRWVMLLLSLIPSRFYGKFFKTSYTLEWGPKSWSRIFHGLCTEISTHVTYMWVKYRLKQKKYHRIMAKLTIFLPSYHYQSTPETGILFFLTQSMIPWIITTFSNCLACLTYLIASYLIALTWVDNK